MANGMGLLTMTAAIAYSDAMTDQHEYRRHLTDQYRKDVHCLITQGRWPPPWVNEDFAIQHDEARLLTAIADNAGLHWRDDNRAICQSVAFALGMNAIGNAKATIKRCLALGYIKARHDRDMAVIMLDLTDLGAAMLELWEDEQHLRTGET